MSQKIRHDQLRTVLIAPHVSEKSTLLSQNSGQIAFRVRVDSNKKQIKKAVEEMFKVKVSSVNNFSKGKEEKNGNEARQNQRLEKSIYKT